MENTIYCSRFSRLTESEMMSIEGGNVWGAIAVGSVAVAGVAVVVITAPVSIPALAAAASISTVAATTVVYGGAVCTAGAGVIGTYLAYNN